MLRSVRAAVVVLCAGAACALVARPAAAITPTVKFQFADEFGLANAEWDLLNRVLADEFPEFDAMEPNFGPRSVGVGVVDLNGDGVDEHLIQVISSSTCQYGCVTYVFQIRAGKWTRIGAISTGTVVINPDLGAPNSPYSIIQGEYNQLRWNGVGYGGFCHEVGVCEPERR